MATDEPTGSQRKTTPWLALLPVLLLSACGGSGGDKDAVSIEADADGDGLIEIRSLEHLDWIRNDLAGTSRHDGSRADSSGCPATGCFGYELATDLDFDTNRNGAADAADSYFDYDRDGSNNGWLPIGTAAEPLTADFEGNGYRISNLYIDRPDADAETSGTDIGLFGKVQGAGITNLVLDGIATSITGHTQVGALLGSGEQVKLTNIELDVGVAGNQKVGGLIGLLIRGRIDNVVSDSTVAGNGGIGGLAGWIDTANNFTSVRNSSTAGSVTGQGSTGGLVGYLKDSSTFFSNNTVGIFDSSSSAAVTGGVSTGGAVGQILGDPNATDGLQLQLGLQIDTVTASGHVIANDQDSGGLIGRATNNVVIRDSAASGDVDGEFQTGGLVGYAITSIDIRDSTASGNVTGNGAVGGFVGRVANLTPNPTNVTIFRCSASGDVANVGGSPPIWTGGMIGFAEYQLNLWSSHSSGNVGTGDFVGGLIGLARLGAISIQSSYATGDIGGRDFVGGLVGSFNFVSGIISGNGGDSILSSFSTGSVTGRNYVGGIAGLSYNVDHNSTFATGSVVGNDLTGGLIGDVNESFDVAQLRNSFSAASVSLTPTPSGSTHRLGGLAGYNDSASFTANYFAIDASGQANALGANNSAGGPNPAGTLGDSLTDLQAPLGPDTLVGGNTLYVGWNTLYWDFGNAVQLPGLKIGPGGSLLRDADADGTLD